VTQNDLAQARIKIDALDEQIQTLISQRARIAQEVAHIKERMGDSTGNHYRPAREAEVLRRAMQRNSGPLTDETIARLMREIMSACLSLESPLKVAYLGPEGTYTQAAVLKHFGESVTARPASTIDEIFRDVETGNADYGVVPVENSLGGIVSHTLDELALTALRICGEVTLPIHHCLLSNEPSIEAITHIWSHQQSFSQCRKWLDTRLPKAEREAVASNAQAVLIAREKGGAAIAGQQTAKLYGMNILASNIEDDPNNTTRFLIIGKHDPTPTGDDVTSLVLTAQRNTPGALFKLLQPFALENLDLTRIESRPVKGAAVHDYYFFIDFRGHAHDARVQKVLEEVRAASAFFKVLGSYPTAPF
jgi:chorismate mutase/prephenate dehydratase